MVIGVYGFRTLGFRVWRGEIADWDMELPKIWGTFLGVPIIRTIIFWGSILESPCFGKPPDISVVLGLYKLLHGDQRSRGSA